MKGTLEKLKSFLRSRQQAYQHTFNPESIYAQRVLKDLSVFCRADQPTFHADPRISAALEGRREVWLRITNHLKMDPETLWKITSGRKDDEA